MADEFHYIDVDTEKLWDDALAIYIAEGGDVLYPGDEKEMLLRAAHAMGVQVLMRCENALRMDTLTYSTGEFLKEYGRKRGCIYIDAVAATAKVEITLQASGVQKTIPAGTELTADGTILYVLQSDIEQTGTAQKIAATVVCATPGAIGNGLRAGTQMQFVEGSEAYASIIVTEGARGGVDAEDEEAYRERIQKYGLASVTTGPAEQYESAAMAVSPQIIAARALNDGGGEVGIYMILEDGADQESIFASVMQALSDIRDRPLTDHVQAHAAAECAYRLKIEVQYSAYSGIGTQLAAAVEAYRKWQDEVIGQAFNPEKLAGLLYTLGCERVRFLEGSGMDGSMEFKQIEKRQRCRGTIEVSVVNT